MSCEQSTMAKDYYEILGVDRSADSDTIKKAYRKLALKWHPDRNPDSKEEAEKNFQEIGEAYSILSDAEKRKAFDQFGEAGLTGSRMGGGTNAEDIFNTFFPDYNPFPFPFPARKGALVKHNLYCSLEELYHGTTKKMRIKRKRLNADGRTTYEDTKTLEIRVKKGWKAGTKITYPNEGDEKPGITPGDIQFILTEKAHPNFQRKGNDLIYKQQISLKQALIGFSVTLDTLDNRRLRIPINKVVSPTYVHRVNNEGMPISKNLPSKGNLLIEFDIVFPQRLSETQKQQIAQCLED